MAAARSIRATSPASLTTRRPSTTPWVGTTGNGSRAACHVATAAQVTSPASSPTVDAPDAPAANASRWATTPPIDRSTCSAAPEAASCSAAWVR